MMKKLLFVIFMFLPMVGMAQNVWEVPSDTVKTTPKTKKKALFEKKNKTVDAKYLAGAVPLMDGKVVFTLDKDVPGMSADQIYEKTLAFLQGLTKEENQFDVSKVAVVNKGQHTIAARYKEWLVFQNTFLSLDRTVFNYTLIARCTDGHLHLTMERLSYQYETEREDTNNGMEINAEDWITDKEALSKKGDKLVKYCGKFRVKTIDRKDNIFSRVCEALNIKY
jgi:hypothetical protein